MDLEDSGYTSGVEQSHSLLMATLAPRVCHRLKEISCRKDVQEDPAEGGAEKVVTKFDITHLCPKVMTAPPRPRHTSAPRARRVDEGHRAGAATATAPPPVVWKGVAVRRPNSPIFSERLSPYPRPTSPPQGLYDVLLVPWLTRKTRPSTLMTFTFGHEQAQHDKSESSNMSK